jgi:transposase
MELRLTMKEQTRVRTLELLVAGKISTEEAAQLLGRSVRQIFRLQRRLLSDGPKGLVHKNRDRPCPRRLPDSLRAEVVELVRREYHDINDTHLCELLAEHKSIKMSRESLRNLLRQNGIAPKHIKKRSKYRSRRPRKEAFGMMIQIDASPHDWLEGRGPWLTLVGGRDDATNHGWARFVEAETTWAYLDLMRDIFTSNGLPLSLYSDRHSIFHSTREPTLQEQLKKQKPLTQFGRAMDELGIQIIPAYSPQAKGRVERFWGFAQDRLVSELRLAKVCTLEKANVVLEKWLSKTVNAHFKVLPAKSQSAFRKTPSNFLLDRILCIKDTRTVAKDHTISFEGLTLQIPPSKKFHSIAGKKVLVSQPKDGSIQIWYRNFVAAIFSPSAVSRLTETKLLGPSNLKKAA